MTVKVLIFLNKILAIKKSMKGGKSNGLMS